MEETLDQLRPINDTIFEDSVPQLKVFDNRCKGRSLQMSEKLFVNRQNCRSIRPLIAFALLSSAVLLTIASPALAGGFQLSLETPSGGDPQLKDAVLIVRTFGCHQPADAKLSASAEGLINGNRKSLALELRSIGSGVYALKQQWPSEGHWVLALTGAYNGMTSSVLVELGANGKVLPGTRLEEGNLKGVHARAVRRTWLAEDIDSALRSTAGVTAPSEENGSASSSHSSVIWLLGLGASVFTIGFVRLAQRVRTPGQVTR
jgi:hypothetical protein